MCQGNDSTPFQGKLKTCGVTARVLGPTVGAWCETSTDFYLLVKLIAHALVDEETSTIQVVHHQSVARQTCIPISLGVAGCDNHMCSFCDVFLFKPVTNQKIRY